MSLDALCRAVASGNTAEAEALTRDQLKKGKDPLEMIAALTEAMNRLGEKFARLEIFLPQLVFAGESLKAVVGILQPEIMASDRQGTTKGKVILGVVKGDLHEIGKNIVKLMLETNGFEVKDLGYDVDSLAFIKEAEAMQADVIAVSALITTTMPGQKEIIDLLKDKGLRARYKVVIGGAPTGPEWAEEIGADLWCEDAASAPRKITELLAAR